MFQLGSFRRRSAILIVTLALSAGALGTVQNAAASGSMVYGQITCVANPPMGAWLTASNGGSGWVNWGRLQGTYTINYSKSLPNGGWWYLAVGCGGSTASWGLTAYSNSYYGGGYYNFTCYDDRSAGYMYKRCQKT